MRNAMPEQLVERVGMTNRHELRVVACVTAYNEEATVGGIVAVLGQCPSIDRVQVVDDGSEDETRECAIGAGAHVISLPERKPVGQAIMHHLTEMQEECILLWCDADLVGLKVEYIEDLVATFRKTGLTQITSSRGVPLNWPKYLRGFPVKQFWGWLFGPISGERAILRSDFLEAIELSRRLEWEEMMRGYGIVLFLNWYSNVFGKGMRVRYFDQLRQRQKYQKWGKSYSWEMWRQWGQFIAVWFKIRLNSLKIRRSRRDLVAAGKFPAPQSD